MLDMTSFIGEFQKELNAKCSQYDRLWVGRKRVFNSLILFSSIVSLTLEGFAASYRLLKGLIRVQNLVLGSNVLPTFAASSLSAARKKLSPYLFVDLSQWLYRFLYKEFKHEKWFGRDVFAIDSTKIIVPKQLKNEGFDDFGSGSFYPMAMLTGLFDVRLGLVYDSLVSQHSDEQLASEALIESMKAGSVLISDRGFFSYRFLQLLKKANIDFVIRLSKSSSPEELKHFFDDYDCYEEVIDVCPSLPSERKIIRQGREVRPIALRVVRDFREDEPIVLLTSLFDEEITADDICGIYKMRWDIEEHYKILKGNFLGEKFRSKNLNGVLQEIFAATFLLNAAQAFTLITLGQKDKKPNRLVSSPSMILGIVRKIFPLLIHMTKPSLADWLKIVEQQIQESMSKFRPNRSYERKSQRPISRWILRTEGVRC